MEEARRRAIEEHDANLLEAKKLAKVAADNEKALRARCVIENCPIVPSALLIPHREEQRRQSNELVSSINQRLSENAAKRAFTSQVS